MTAETDQPVVEGQPLAEEHAGSDAELPQLCEFS